MTGPTSQCFSIQSTKVEEDEGKRLLIEFPHDVGLEIIGDSVAMDVSLTPKMEMTIHAKPGGKTASGGKWVEQSLQVVGHKKPHRIKLFLACRREPGTTKLREMLNKVPSLKRAIDGGIANVYDLCDDTKQHRLLPCVFCTHFLRPTKLNTPSKCMDQWKEGSTTSCGREHVPRRPTSQLADFGGLDNRVLNFSKFSKNTR